MTLGNMREQGGAAPDRVCLHDACRRQAIIDVSKYPDDVEVQKEQPTMSTKPRFDYWPGA